MSEVNGSTYRVWTRALREDAGKALVYEGVTPDTALINALAVEPEVESVIFWEDAKYLCAVDLDVDESEPYDLAGLLEILDWLQPGPCLSWTTHGGGLRLCYKSHDQHRADEVAAVALLNLSERARHTALELKSATRHPSSPDRDGRRGGEVVKREQIFDTRALRRWLRVWEACDEEVLKWLEERSLEVGCRYDHIHCPVQPSNRGGRQPVFVGDRGIHCFICEAAGVCRGSSKAGFFPYASLCGAPRASPLYRCLERAAHWEHARFVCQAALRVPLQYQRLVYSAGVALHRGRQDADAAMVAGRDLVRMGDRWANLSGEPYQGDLRPILQALPACRFRDDKGKVGVDRELVAKFGQPHDLAQYGYPSLRPVFGTPLWPEDPDSNAPLRAVVQTRELSGDGASGLRPEYISKYPNPWPQLERAMPGLCKELVLLLVAARGFAEGEASMPPMVFVTGPTGASKSLSVHLAASICGDRNTEVVWTSNGERLRQAVAEAGASGTFVTFNEVLKEARRQVKQQGFAMDYVLNLTPDSTSHAMYIGPVRMGRLPVLVWTDTDLPDQVRKDAQLARRIVHVRLAKQVDWEGPLANSGVGHPKRLRQAGIQWAEAANAVLSEVIDRFMRPPSTFENCATELGFHLMRDSEEAEEGRGALRNLYEQVCAAPEAAGSDAERWKGRGWKVLARDQETPLRDAWHSIADEDQFFQSRSAAEVDWQRVCGLAEPCHLETRQHGSRLALRFRSVEGTRSTYRVNDELRKEK